MEKTLKNIVLKTALTGLAIGTLTGCTTVKDAWNYDGDLGPAYRQEEGIKNVMSIHGSSCYPLHSDVKQYVQ